MLLDTKNLLVEREMLKTMLFMIAVKNKQI